MTRFTNTFFSVTIAALGLAGRHQISNFFKLGL